MLLFFLGFFLGSFVGVATVCLLVISKEKDRPDVCWLHGHDRSPDEGEVRRLRQSA